MRDPARRPSSWRSTVQTKVRTHLRIRSSDVKGYPFEVAVPSGNRATGAILADDAMHEIPASGLLVRECLFGVIDDQHFYRGFAFFQLQSQLLLQRSV